MATSEWPLVFKRREDLELIEKETEARKSFESFKEIVTMMKNGAQKAKTTGNRENVCYVVDARDNSVVSSGEDATGCIPHSLDHAVMECLKAAAIATSKQNEESLLGKRSEPEMGAEELSGEEQYLCTGLDVYCFEEPCNMGVKQA